MKRYLDNKQLFGLTTIINLKNFSDAGKKRCIQISDLYIFHIIKRDSIVHVD